MRVLGRRFPRGRRSSKQNPDFSFGLLFLFSDIPIPSSSTIAAAASSISSSPPFALLLLPS